VRVQVSSVTNLIPWSEEPCKYTQLALLPVMGWNTFSCVPEDISSLVQTLQTSSTFLPTTNTLKNNMSTHIHTYAGLVLLGNNHWWHQLDPSPGRASEVLSTHPLENLAFYMDLLNLAPENQKASKMTTHFWLTGP